ncbi:acyl-homoserine-lactone synthase [Sphingosinicella rhizophila]|uniref:Acyl-homoserine-lactone synthase n=1 Tax=Sphingosinicella rhizophila TaxID=3050082 RepID=A0ABU3Q8Y9_9SPHN|nr:acyl-homoserine-lactone synthase [Sphingosinicella sp. GR2756]MDT9599871.1 acyl-homoserine-lactone synthase [Sphingosinicella sp. GR2756]
MVTVAEGIPAPLHLPALRGMFEARKRVFVDLLKWNVPVLEGRYEVDQFDDEDAVYLIVPGEDGRHAGSARLLKTIRPHILDTLFPELCAAPVPRGAGTLEITRFCLDRAQSADARLETRNCLVSGLVRYALENGVETYTGVAEMGWLQQILAFGWRCRPLGLPRRIDGKMLGALRIDINDETPALLEANGIYRSAPVRPLELLAAA